VTGYKLDDRGSISGWERFYVSLPHPDGFLYILNRLCNCCQAQYTRGQRACVWSQLLTST
jgi:hypothetical protein